jgi:hypothetical protein
MVVKKTKKHLGGGKRTKKVCQKGGDPKGKGGKGGKKTGRVSQFVRKAKNQVGILATKIKQKFNSQRKNKFIKKTFENGKVPNNVVIRPIGKTFFVAEKNGIVKKYNPVIAQQPKPVNRGKTDNTNNPPPYTKYISGVNNSTSNVNHSTSLPYARKTQPKNSYVKNGTDVEYNGGIFEYFNKNAKANQREREKYEPTYVNFPNTTDSTYVNLQKPDNNATYANFPSKPNTKQEPEQNIYTTIYENSTQFTLPSNVSNKIRTQTENARQTQQTHINTTKTFTSYKKQRRNPKNTLPNTPQPQPKLNKKSKKEEKEEAIYEELPEPPYIPQAQTKPALPTAPKPTTQPIPNRIFKKNPNSPPPPTSTSAKKTPPPRPPPPTNKKYPSIPTAKKPNYTPQRSTKKTQSLPGITAANIASIPKTAPPPKPNLELNNEGFVEGPIETFI